MRSSFLVRLCFHMRALPGLQDIIVFKTTTLCSAYHDKTALYQIVEWLRRKFGAKLDKSLTSLHIETFQNGNARYSYVWIILLVK